MKSSRFTEEQKIGILREADSSSTVKKVCAKHNISDATFYTWKKKFGGMDVSEARRLKALEDEKEKRHHSDERKPSTLRVSPGDGGTEA